MTKTSEPELGRAVMLVLADEPKGEATVKTMVKKVPHHINLTAQDFLQSEKRPNEAMWEQRVRNLKSHDKTTGNVIGEGYVINIRRGWYRLTDAGWTRLGLRSPT